MKQVDWLPSAPLIDTWSTPRQRTTTDLRSRLGQQLRRKATTTANAANLTGQLFKPFSNQPHTRWWRHVVCHLTSTDQLQAGARIPHGNQKPSSPDCGCIRVLVDTLR